MSNTQECTKQLKRYLIARIPLIVVNDELSSQMQRF